MKKKVFFIVFLLLLISIIILLIPTTTKATVYSDAEGSPSVGSGGSVGECNFLALQKGYMLKISLVELTESGLNNKSSVVYKANGNSGYDFYFENGYQYSSYYGKYFGNLYGANKVCGKITSSGYTAECETNTIISTSNWFSEDGNMLNIKSKNIETYLKIESNFIDTLKNLGIQSLIETDISKINSLDELSNSDKIKLQNYRVIVEPVYVFADCANTDVKTFATIKGIANIVINNNKSNVANPLSAYLNRLADNMRSYNNHGKINLSSYTIDNTFSGTQGSSAYFEVLANAYSGYGYNIFYIFSGTDINKTMCDTANECCYDKNGIYNSDFYGNDDNYKLENNMLTSCNPNNPDIPIPTNCKLEESKELGCSDTNTTFEGNCNMTVTYDVSLTSSTTNCGIQRSSATRSAKIRMSQTGKLTFNLSPTKVYSGGGFSFGITYSNSASWSIISSDDCGTLRRYYDGTCTDDSGNTFACCLYADDGTPDGCSSGEILEWVTYKVQSYYKGLSSSAANVVFPNSNEKNGGTNSNTGTWTCESPSRFWASTLTSTCHFDLYDAYIDRKTAQAVYGDISNVDDYLDEGKLYFTPLKYSGYFPIHANFSNLSSLSNMTWGATYDCGVDCYQNFYDCEDADCSTVKGYKFYYRPITLSDPFPNRIAGPNWFNWISLDTNKQRLANTYSNLEYTATLTNENMATILQYNSNNSYLNYSINNNGSSSFINDNLTAIFNRNLNTTYSKKRSN